ncbi:MAG: hypothetical protein ABIC96_04125 [Patescibacteria group bacterium]
MKIENLKLKIGLLVVLVVLVVFPEKASASGISLGVSPPIIQIDTQAPSSIKAPFSIKNLGDENQELSILFKPFKASPQENGEVSYLPIDEIPGADPFIFEKIHIIDNDQSIVSVTLAPGQQKDLTLSIEIPRDEPPSDYYFSITFMSHPELAEGSKSDQMNQDNKQNQSLSIAGISTNVLLSIGPKGETQGTLEEFSSPFFLEKGPVPFTVRVKNASAFFIVPKGNILIKNMFGQTVGKINLLPVNILSDSIRQIPDSPESLNALWPESFILGFYSAQLNLALSDSGPIYNKTVYFIGFPIQALIGLLIVIFLILLIRNRIRSRELAIFIFCGLIFLTFFPKIAHAGVLTRAQDLISTSRSSPSTTLNLDQPANANFVSIIDNGSVFLASDSATLLASGSGALETRSIASLSAQINTTLKTRNLYFDIPFATAHHKGDIIVAPAKAWHKIQFTTASAIPANGKIIITFPGVGSNTATPSANTFSFNNLQASDIKVDGVTCSLLVVSAPNITCTIDSSGLAAAKPITFLIGCLANTASSCTSPAPILINPIKTQTSGISDIWNLTVKTQNASLVDIDAVVIKIGTLEGVQIQTKIDPTLTVAISGLLDGTSFKSLSSMCPDEKTNSGVASTPASVNLGLLSTDEIKISGQAISVSTNSPFGYVITASSSGKFKDAASGNFISDANGGDGLTSIDTPAPKTLPPMGKSAFGISPCGKRVPNIWTPGNILTFGSGGKLSNPWSTSNLYYALLAFYTGRPVENDVTVIRYAATIADNTPPGDYSTVMTYTIMPIF